MLFAASIYVADRGNGRAVRLPGGALQEIALAAFPPDRLAIDAAGDIIILTAGAIVTYSAAALDFRPLLWASGRCGPARAGRLRHPSR